MSQRREKKLRQLERRVSALENQAAARKREDERMWQIHIQPAESAVDAEWIPAKPRPKRGILRRIADFFRGGDSNAL